MQRFTEDEAREILTRAARQPLGGEVSRDELLRSAAELGISEEALVRAQAEVGEERLRAAFEAGRKKDLRISVLTYVLVMALLIGINLATGTGHLWFIYPLLGWGFAVAVQVAAVRNREGEDYQKAFARYRKRHSPPALD